MSTQTDAQIQRPVNELLGLDTFQGMTDAEIQSLIDYHVSRALVSQDALLRMQTEMGYMEQKISDGRESAARALDMVQSLAEVGVPQVASPAVASFEAKTVTPICR
jgi:hypothetical protein